MTKQEFYAQLDEILENPPGTITGDEMIADLERWDSLAAILFIAMLDQHLGITAEASKVAECKSVQDLVALGGGKVT